MSTGNYLRPIKQDMRALNQQLFEEPSALEEQQRRQQMEEEMRMQ